MAPGRKKGANHGKARHPLSLGDLVLAKVKGFPFWPAKIGRPEDWKRSPDHKKYFVEFFGTGESAFVAPVDIQAFTSEAKSKLVVRCQRKSPKYFARAVKEICVAFEELQENKARGSGEDIDSTAADCMTSNDVIMDTQLDGIGSSVDPSGRKRYGKSIKWTPDLCTGFLRYVAEEVRKGHKKNNTLDREGWAHVIDRFQVENRTTVTIDQVRNHFDKTRRLWQAWRYLATHTGLGWDPLKQTYTASDSFWDGFRKMYKDGMQLRYRGITSLEEQYLQTIYGGSVATGEDRWTPSSCTIPPNEDELDLDPVEPHEQDDNFTLAIDENISHNVEETVPPNVEINNAPNLDEPHNPRQTVLGTRSRATTPSSLNEPSTRRRRRSVSTSNESHMSRACDLMEQRTKLMEKTLAPESNLANFEKCVQFLETLPSFSTKDPMFGWAPSFLCKKVKRLMFISMANPELRELWLRSEYGKSAGSRSGGPEN